MDRFFYNITLLFFTAIFSNETYASISTPHGGAPHFYKIDNQACNSSILLFGSHNTSPVSALPPHMVDTLFTADGIYSDTDTAAELQTEILMLESLKDAISKQDLHRIGNNTGFMDRQESNAVSNLLYRHKIQSAENWYDLVRQDLTPETIHFLNSRAQAFGYDSSEELLNQFHPLIAPIIINLITQKNIQDTGAEPMNLYLFNRMTLNLNKPGDVLEKTTAYAKLRFESEIAPMLETLSPTNLFSMQDINKIKKALSAIQLQGHKKTLLNLLAHQTPSQKYLSGQITKSLFINEPNSLEAKRVTNWLPVIREILKNNGKTIAIVVDVQYLYGSFGLLDMLSGYKTTRWNLQTQSF